VQPDRPVQTTLAFHASRIVIDVGVLIAMASMSMTFISAPDGGRSALAADAFPAVLLLVPIFLVTLIPDHTRPLHPALGWASMVLALAALPYALVKLLDAGVLADTLGGSVGIGPTILLLGCVVTLIGIGIGIARDILGKPSGGTPQRHASYETKRSRARAGRQDTPTPTASTRATESAAADPAQAIVDEAPTRIVEPTGTEPGRDAPQPDDQVPEPEPEPEPESEPDPIAQQPEILFPDTGAVVREAEPVDDPADGLLDTAERADAALTESLLSMFDEDDPDDDNT
jgi:hypothetical protein